MMKVKYPLPKGGMSVHKPPLLLPLKAAYGIHLMRVCRKADEEGAKVGRFIEAHIPTLEEFKQLVNKRLV